MKSSSKPVTVVLLKVSVYGLPGGPKVACIHEQENV